MSDPQIDAQATEFRLALRDQIRDGRVDRLVAVDVIPAPHPYAQLEALVRELFAALRDADSATITELVAEQLVRSTPKLQRLANAEAALRNAVQEPRPSEPELLALLVETGQADREFAALMRKELAGRPAWEQRVREEAALPWWRRALRALLPRNRRRP